jgi:hypothetical protein
MATMADKHEFNRRVETEKLAAQIDHNGINIIECMMMYHRASFGPTPKDKPIWPDHHRCYVYAKIKGQDEPVNFFLDVEASFWDRLKTVEELEAAMADPITMGIARARLASVEEQLILDGASTVEDSDG